MDLSCFPRLADLSGNTLSIEETCGLETAMEQRKLEENITGNLLFWGKVYGNTQDYLIVYTVNYNGEFPEKRFYYCNPPDYILRAVPALSLEYEKQASTINVKFTGDPSFYAFNGDEAEDDADPEAPPVERFREVHRLAYSIKCIDHDCAITPRGAHVIDASKKLVSNPYYSGISAASVTEARSFLHMRKPENPQAIAMMKKPGIVKSGDFLDSIEKDQPALMWNISTDATNKIGYIRNLYWEGYHFYTLIDGVEYGGAYFGIGIPQNDISFMF